MEDFLELSLCTPIRRALQEQGYTSPTLIQSQAIRAVLQGRDVLACAQTGTGKTAAFVLPILQQASSTGIYALILSPTRELAVQIGTSIRNYGMYLTKKHTVIYGGVDKETQITPVFLNKKKKSCIPLNDLVCF